MLLRYKATGDRAIRDRVVERCQPLARSLAARYYSGGEPMEDLLQVANLGLIKAIEGFDPSIGRSFASYAAPMILGELRHHFRDRAWGIHMPRRLQENAMRIAKVSEELRAEHLRAPTTSELAAACGLTEGEVIEALVADSARRTASLDSPMRADDEEATPLVEMIADEDPGFDQALSGEAATSAPLLPRERQVIDLRFGRQLTQREVGERIGISQMQVSRIQRSALLKLLAAVRGEGEDPEQLEELMDSAA
jgi:RNA polymerase sigma-B factor